MDGGAGIVGYLLLLCTFMTSIIGSRSADYASSNRDNLCNNETNFVCVCYKGDGSLLKVFPDCKSFIGSPTLPVVKYTVELKPNKDITKHEEYFKPTIVATLIERYCMNGTHECIGTTLPIDYSNVIVLKLTYSNEQQRQATVYYTVAKPRNPKLLTVNNTMTPEKIVHILNLTLDKRPDIIGQAKILEHTSAEITVDGAITVAKDSYDHFHENIVFFIFLIVLGLIVGAIYVIAIVKVIRDHKRQRETRSKKQDAVGGNTTPNYGAINHSELRCEIVSSTTDHERNTGRSSVVERTSIVVQQQECPYYIPPLRVGDIDAYEAAEPESPRSLYAFLLTRFPLNKLIKTTSIYSFSSKHRRRDSMKKSKSAHHYISEEVVALKNMNLEELRQFASSSDSPLKLMTDSGIHFVNAPRIKIDEVQVVSTDDSFRDETQQTPDEDRVLNENNEFANFDVFLANSEQVATNGPVYNDWPTVNNFELDKPKGGHLDNLHNSLSAAAILTTSYTEENLIKSEVSSIADSNSGSESDDISEHLTQPISDYQPLRESTWSISQPQVDQTENIDLR